MYRCFFRIWHSDSILNFTRVSLRNLCKYALIFWLQNSKHTNNIQSCTWGYHLVPYLNPFINRHSFVPSLNTSWFQFLRGYSQTTLTRFLEFLIPTSPCCLCSKVDFWLAPPYHTLSPNFFRGVWDQNENLVGRKLKIGRKIFARLRRAKKGVPKFFACGGLFSSWRHWKPLKNR